MNKIIKVVKFMFKIEEYKITEDEVINIIKKKFKELNKDGNKYLNAKDLILLIVEYYKSKK